MLNCLPVCRCCRQHRSNELYPANRYISLLRYNIQPSRRMKSAVHSLIRASCRAVLCAAGVSVLELLLLLPHPVKQSVAVTAQTQSANAPMTVAVVFLFVVFFILITSLLEFVLFIYVFLFCGYILSFFLMEYNIRFPRDSSIKRHLDGEVSFWGQVDINLSISL